MAIEEIAKSSSHETVIVQYGPLGGAKFALVHQRKIFCSFSFKKYLTSLCFYKGFTIIFLGNVVLPLISQEKKACLALAVANDIFWVSRERKVRNSLVKPLSYFSTSFLCHLINKNKV